MLVLLCFCVATEFSVNEDLYLNQLTIDFDFCMFIGPICDRNFFLRFSEEVLKISIVVTFS